MSESDDGDRLSELNVRSAEQRQRFAKTLGVAAQRLRPANLAREAGNRTLDFGLDTIESAKAAVRTHPVKAIGAATLVGAFFARRPLFRLAMKGVAAGKQRFSRKSAG
jgi:hypothetical protein